MTQAHSHVAGSGHYDRMWCPDSEASRLGIRVLTAREMDERGLWVPDLQTILIRADLSEAEHRSVLTHELAHAYYFDAELSEPVESRANRWASNRLIDVNSIVDVALTHPERPDLWCDQLEVTPEILTAWLSQSRNVTSAERAYYAA